MRSVLIVDDDPDIRVLVRMILERAAIPFEVVGEADNGARALREWQALLPPPLPHVIVLDNFMPDRTGLEVAEEILEVLPTQSIVLFSAFMSPELRRQAEALGVSVCLGKEDVDRLPGILEGLLPDSAD